MPWMTRLLNSIERGMPAMKIELKQFVGNLADNYARWILETLVSAQDEE